MKISINNLKEAIIAIISLSVELPDDIQPSDLGLDTSVANFWNTVYTMKSEKLLSKRKGTDVIRLKSPAGRSELLNISQSLSKRYEGITNGHNIRTGKSANERLRVYRDAVLYMLKKKVTIDNIELDYSPNYFGRRQKDSDIAAAIFGDFNITNVGEISICDEEGNILPIETLCKSLPVDKSFFYSSKLLKAAGEKSGSDKQTSRISTSIFSGVLLSGENAMTVYYIHNPEMTYSKENERQAKKVTSNMYKSAYGTASLKKNIIRVDGGQTLLIFNNKEDILTMFRSKSNKRFRPDQIYNNVHIITKDEECDDAFWLLRQKDFRKKTLDALYYYEEQTPKKKCDAILEGSIPSWEFITSDFSKIDQIRSIKERKINIICYDWQKSLLKNLLRGYAVDFDILDEERLAQLKEIISET